jgi:hypothetical protein
MMNKKTQEFRKKIQLFTAMASLSISLTSFSYLSYAWFTNQRVQEVQLMQVNIEEGLEYKFKFFDGNYNNRDYATGTNAGYQSPTALADPAEWMMITDYATEFDLVTEAMMAPESTSNPLAIVDIYPGIQYTFSIEVTSRLVAERDISFILKEFTALGEEDVLDATTLNPISLSSAIDIYVDTIDTYGKTPAQITAAANAFIQDSTPTDAFDLDTEGGIVDLPLAGSSIQPAVDMIENSIIFIFTIKFSDNSATYYRWDSSSSGISYYERSILGNSNVYQGKTFAINELFIHLIN